MLTSEGEESLKVSPTVNSICYDTNLPGKVCPLVKQWHKGYGNCGDIIGEHLLYSKTMELLLDLIAKLIIYLEVT